MFETLISNLKFGAAFSSFVITMILMLVGPLLTFPFYLYVHLLNKKRDEETAIFPLTYQIFITTSVTCGWNYVCLLITLLAYLFRTDSYAMISVVLLYLALFCWALLIIIRVIAHFNFNLLLLSLAIHRFFLYFFSDLVGKINFSKRHYLWLMPLHVVSLLIGGGLLYMGWLVIMEDYDFAQYQSLLIAILAFNLLVMAASLPYFLMLFSISKLRMTMSRIHSKPEQYIRYQIALLFVEKLLVVVSFSFPFIQEAIVTDPERDLHEAIAIPIVMDILLTAILTQLCYLLCNKRNMDTLFEMSWSLRTFKVLLGMHKAEVQPAQQLPIQSISRSTPGS